MINSVQLTVQKPSLFSSMTLSASFNNSSASATVTPVTATVVFNYSPPIVIGPGGTINFTLMATLAPAGQHAAPQSASSDSGTGPGSGMIEQAMAVPGGGAAPGLLLMSIVTLLFALTRLPAEAKPKLAAMALGAMFCTMSIVGCDPCPRCAPSNTGTSNLTVTAVNGSDTQGNHLTYAPVPGSLDQVVRK